MRIAVDAMGSDSAPDVEVEGAVDASLNTEEEILLVGDEAVLNEKLEAFPKRGNISVVHAPTAIGMHESPVMAVRQKRDSSLMVGMRLLKTGEADAFVCAGNTGAAMVGARTVLGSLPGVSRPAIAQIMPTAHQGFAVVLDLGANVDCTTRQLCEFAEMGIAFSHYAMGVENPRVGLLNIGEENLKGTQVARDANLKLSKLSHIEFAGNLEPKAMYSGDADVVVCDGFIGNLFLKTSEAVAEFMGKMIREYFESSSMSKIGAMLARKALKDMKERVDPNEYGGSPLLGVNGIVLILHGSCTARGVTRAIEGAHVAHENKLNEHIRENIEKLRGEELDIREGRVPATPKECPDPKASGNNGSDGLSDKEEVGQETAEVAGETTKETTQS
jgi:phosphate acyltransferase